MKRALHTVGKGNSEKDTQFFWSFFRNPHMGVVITDLFGNLVQVNEAADKKVFQSKLPDNFFDGLTAQREHDLQALRRGHLIADHASFVLNAQESTYTVYGVKQHEPLMFVWMIPLAPVEKSNPVPLDNYYQLLVENTFELIFRTNTEGAILFHNKLFEKTFGYTPGEIAGIPVRDLFMTPESYQVVLSIILAKGTCENTTIHLKQKDGTLIIGKLNARLDAEAVGKTITWTVLDVTQHHEYELSLMQKNDDLAKINAQMEKFLYSTSHDLRSPLTSVLGLVNLMRIEKPNEAVLDYVDKIESCINRLDEIIKDIMRFSKNSYQRLLSEKIFLETLIWKNIRSHKSLPYYRRINFEVSVEENETFFSDTERLEIILNNIIRNAIMFSDPHKSKPFVTIKAKALAGEAVIEIMDNGIGIGRSHIDQVFNMFYRATDRSKGAGLGLYVAKEAAERLKGIITVESEVGFGTIFRIRIPYDHKGRLISRKHHLQQGAAH